MATRIDWKAAVWAGIIAGLVFMMLQMALMVMLQGQSPWGPPRMMAAMVLGKGVLPQMGQPATFDPMIMMVAMVIHMMMSIIFGIVLGWGISRFALGMAAALIVGLVFGMVIYFVDFDVIPGMGLFSWFAMARGPITIFTHAMFGLVAGGVYHAIAAHDAKKAGEARATGAHA